MQGMPRKTHRSRISPNLPDRSRRKEKPEFWRFQRPSSTMAGRQQTLFRRRLRRVLRSYLEPAMDVTLVAEHFQRATEEIGKVLVGQHELVEATLIALFCEGNILIEGVPGLGKTLLVNTLSKVLSCGFKRVQFTPDLMPSDLTGHSIYNMADRQFNFNAGPIFTNLLLADEINRAPAKTQSALLEAMQERQVTVDGTTYRLDRPFITIATQNPLEQEGTYPLPEAQLDRFMFKLLVGYPAPTEEQEILKHYAEGRDARDLSRFDLAAVLTGPQVLEVQQATLTVIVEPSIINYISAIV